MLPQLISTALEQALNRYLAADPDPGVRLKPLVGKRLALKLRELPFELQLQFCSRQVVVMASDESHAEARVQLSVLDLPQMTDGSALTQLIKQEKLALDGDAALLQQFARLLKETEFDLAEQLSQVVGDIPAHQLQQLTRKGQAYLRRQAEAGEANLFEYLTDEVALLPHPRMLTEFTRAVTRLAEDVSAAEQRLATLTAQIRERHNP